MRSTTDMWPIVWPGVKTTRTLPSPNTSNERAKPENEFGVVRVEVDQAVVEAVVELALHVPVALAAARAASHSALDTRKVASG